MAPQPTTSQEIAILAQQHRQDYGETPLTTALEELQELLERLETIESEDTQTKTQQEQIRISIIKQVTAYTGKAADIHNIRVQLTDTLDKTKKANTTTNTKIDADITRTKEFITLTQEIIQAIEIQESNIIAITPKKIGDYDDKKIDKIEKAYDDLLTERLRLSTMNTLLTTPLPDTTGITGILQALKEEPAKLKKEVEDAKTAIKKIEDEEKKKETEYIQVTTYIAKEKDDVKRKRNEVDALTNMTRLREHYKEQKEQVWKTVDGYLQQFQRDAEHQHRIIIGIIGRVQRQAEALRSEQERQKTKNLTSTEEQEKEIETLRDTIIEITRQMSKITKEKTIMNIPKEIRTLNGLLQTVRTNNTQLERMITEVKTMNETLQETITSASSIRQPRTKEIKEINRRIEIVDARIAQLEREPTE